MKMALYVVYIQNLILHYLLSHHLTADTEDREVIFKRIEQSYFHEGYEIMSSCQNAIMSSCR